MSGGKCTGEHGHAYLLQLREDVSRAELVVDFPSEPSAHGRAVVEALGAKVRVKPA
jgi:hypothetical protein